MDNALQYFSTFFYFLFAILCLVAGIIGYGRQKNTGWMMIGIYGGLEVLANGCNTFITYKAVIGSYSDYAPMFLILRFVYAAAAVCLVVGLFLLSGKKRQEEPSAFDQWPK